MVTKASSHLVSFDYRHCPILASILVFAFGVWMAHAQTSQVLTSKPAYGPGEAITIAFSGGPANAKDWIGIYPKGVTPGSTPSALWFYVNGTQTASVGLAAGSVTFTGGLSKTGPFDVHLLRDDGYSILASTSLNVITLDPPAASPAHFTSRATEVPFFVNNHQHRFNGTARISGDGKKLVLVRQHSFESMALVSWVSTFTNRLTEADLARVFLYELATGELKTVFTGTQAQSSVKSGGWILTRRDAQIASDINYDGSRVVVYHSDQRLGVSAEGVATNLLSDRVLLLIDTGTGETLFTNRFPTGGINQPIEAIKLNDDGSRTVFRSQRRGEARNTWGVDYFAEAPGQLYSLALSGTAQPTQLSEGDGTMAPQLSSEGFDRMLFSFDVDAAGDRVVFTYNDPKQVIGVHFDGTGRRVISSKSDTLFASLTRDGEHVVYSFWGASSPVDDAVTYVNSFAGTDERVLIDRKLEPYSSWTGPFIPGDDAKELLFGAWGGPAMYRPHEAERAVRAQWLGARIVDASDDLKTVLTEMEVSAWSGIMTYYTSRFEEDSDQDGLGDDWERLHFGTVDDGSVWVARSRNDDDVDGMNNEWEYQLGTAPKSKDTDGDGIDDGTEHTKTGTNPLDARSRFAVESLAMADGGLRFRWNTVNGKNYRVQTITSLGGSSAWQNLSERIRGDGQAAEFSAAPSAQTTVAFYRLILE